MVVLVVEMGGGGGGGGGGGCNTSTSHSSNNNSIVPSSSSSSSTSSATHKPTRYLITLRRDSPPTTGTGTALAPSPASLLMKGDRVYVSIEYHSQQVLFYPSLTLHDQPNYRLIITTSSPLTPLLLLLLLCLLFLHSSYSYPSYSSSPLCIQLSSWPSHSLKYLILPISPP